MIYCKRHPNDLVVEDGFDQHEMLIHRCTICKIRCWDDTPKEPYKSCPNHPGVDVWHHQDGDRCSTCGLFFNHHRVNENHEVLFIDHHQETCEKTSYGWQEGVTLTPQQTRLLMCSLGLSAQVGEFVKIAKGIIYHGHSWSQPNIAKMESVLADADWYMAEAFNTLKASRSRVATKNCAKLRRRYPNGIGHLMNVRKEMARPPDPEDE